MKRTDTMIRMLLGGGLVFCSASCWSVLRPHRPGRQRTVWPYPGVNPAFAYSHIIAQRPGVSGRRTGGTTQHSDPFGGAV